MPTLRNVLILLLLCQSVSAQGPMLGVWHVDGHGCRWQQEQIAAGFPLEPSIRLPALDQARRAQRLAKLAADAPVLAKFSGHPLVLRMNNITAELDRTIPRVSPLTDANWRSSHVCVRIHPVTGELDDTPLPSPFVESSAAWAECGRQWATSPWMVRLQKIIPEPRSLTLRENNEGARLRYTSLYLSAGVQRMNSKGQLVLAGPKDDPSTFVYADHVAPWTVFSNPSGKLRSCRWKTDAELDAIDLRAKEWVGPRRNSSPLDPQHAADFHAAENRLYRALYDAFDENLSAGWRGKLRTVGYGHFDENHQNDAASVPLYLGFYRPQILTDPKYRASFLDARQHWETALDNPRSWREWSVRCGARAVYTGAISGMHNAVDPPSYAGFMTHVMWLMQHPGREVRLTYWDNYNTLPSQKLLSGEQHAAACRSIGREDLLDLTIEDFEVALLRAMRFIHQQPLVNRYWRDGTTSLLDSTQNGPDAVRVYATETKIVGEPRSLLAVYTPCSFDKIEVGGHILPMQTFGYYLTEPLEPVPQAVEASSTSDAIDTR